MLVHYTLHDKLQEKDSSWNAFMLILIICQNKWVNSYQSLRSFFTPQINRGEENIKTSPKLNKILELLLSDYSEWNHRLIISQLTSEVWKVGHPHESMCDPTHCELWRHTWSWEPSPHPLLLDTPAIVHHTGTCNNKQKQVMTQYIRNVPLISHLPADFVIFFSLKVRPLNFLI